MNTIFRKPWRLPWWHRTEPVKHDPVAEKSHSDRWDALFIVGIMVVVFALIITISAISGTPSGTDTINPWMMP
ncbi:MAG: hypothetical protein JXM70_10525 [Pirellulales bacterium]|nr:hypothetical protein [Pirellulales bacterium]